MRYALSPNLVGRDGIVNRKEAVCRPVNAQRERTSVENFDLHLAVAISSYQRTPFDPFSCRTLE